MSITALVVVQVLGGIGLVTAIPLVVRAARRRRFAGEPRHPRSGGPAQGWLSRAELARDELAASLAGHPAGREMSADVDQVVAGLRAIAGQVAELDHAGFMVGDHDLSATCRLLDVRAALLARMSAAVTSLEQARAEVTELIALGPGADPASPLTSRLAGLREGLTEVRGLTDPETGSGSGRTTRGHP